jgi:hypothetical protein
MLEPLPEVLLPESPATKFLYSWLLTQGSVSYTVRDIADATGLAFKSVSDGLGRLRALSLLHETAHAAGAMRRIYHISKTS